MKIMYNKNEQLQKFFAIAEPRSENAIRKAEERKTKRKVKELLLTDLCARLPYEVCINDRGTPYRLVNICWDGIKFVVNCSPFGTGHGRIGTPLFDGDICFIKPYLRPMSSMTEEEIIEFNNIPSTKNYTIIENDLPWDVAHYKQIEWLNKNMFDYRGLISAGLAISTEVFNPYKN